ncbi:MAG: transposase, partial [Clostridiales bacterium]|nr:transposase [Clostridiales bacterium]
MKYIEGQDRDQMLLLPDCIEDYITDDNPIRAIDAFVDGLDLAALGFQRATPRSMGRPAYDPRLLLKLYIYGYFNRIRTSRKLM